MTPWRLSPAGLIALKAAVHVLALLPAGWLGYAIWRVGQFGEDILGAEPVVAIEHFTGLWALRFLLGSLAITPLRRLSGQPLFLRFRRMLGLYAAFYATLHVGAYLFLDLRLEWSIVLEDILKRPYITVGFAAWLALMPLVLTSTQGWIRRLGKRWAQLHRVVYAIGVLAVLHFWWLVKADISEPLLYAGILAVLLGLRLFWRFQPRGV